jgi:error-prone DNA polymerase
MICRADTIGVFQIESRAQMSMLPRLRPRSFYDLVIEVAIVRPGPIQGNMVHPYLRRRCGQEPVSYPSEALRNVLHKTLGVPLFQEQAMRVAMVAAGFSAGEADQLRRAMAAWRKNGAINKFYHKIIDGMLKNGYTREFAENTFQQIQGFGEYGFPESHSASFALLVYVSAWIKCHHPAVFCAALLNSQPMGFYAPAQIVRDAREHGVEVLPVDVNGSGWDCSLSPSPLAGEGRGEGKTQNDNSHGKTRGTNVSASPDHHAIEPVTSTPHPNPLPQGEREQCPAVRLGFREIKGFSQVFAQQIELARKDGIFQSIADFQQRTGLPKKIIEKLAEADCFGSLNLTRRQALWQVLELDDAQLPLFTKDTSSLRLSVSSSLLPPMPLPQEVKIDYQTTNLSLKKHPVSLIREALTQQRILTSKEVNQTPAGRWVKVVGLVLIRQRPGTASGIVFITLEDETGVVNLIVRPNIWDKYRAAARHAGLLQCDGYVERQGEVVHVMAKRLFDRSEMIAGYELASRDFH